MKRLYLFILFQLIVHCAISQEIKADVSFKYMYSEQWDRAIQTYNLSRPYLTVKQPVFKNGVNASVSYIFKSTKVLNYGINMSYSFFRSSAENINFENILNLHLLNLGYVIHYENKEKMNGLYSDLTISALSSGVYRNVNGEPFIYDEKTSKAFGIGGDIQLKFGYYFKLKNKSYISPFIAASYTPFIYSPNFEGVVNQTKGLTSNNWTGLLNAQVGLSFHIKRGKQKIEQSKQ